MRQHVALLCVIALTTALSAQDYRVEVRLVESEVRVTDRAGRPITDLTRADFTLTENGVPHDVATVQFVPQAENDRGTWEAPDGMPGEPVAAPIGSPTWVYVAAEVGTTDTKRTIEALRAFVLGNLRPGFHVSIGNRPFTDARTDLIATINKLERGPLGGNGLSGLVDLSRPMADDAAIERANAANIQRQNDGVAPLMGFMVRPQQAPTNAALAAPVTEGLVDRQLPIYGEVALNQYFGLVERLAPLPGKKAIVLMRPGLRLEQDNAGLFRDLASFAVRRRVSFYTVDSRGLNPQTPVDERGIAPTIDGRRRRAEPDLVGQSELRALAREGLENLARETGGYAIIGSNRLADVFDRVVRDASGYYVVSYYPVDLRSAGRFRALKFNVTRLGARVQAATRGYYEPRTTSMFAKDDRGLALRQAMQRAEVPVDLPVAASVGMFASDEGFPVLVLSAGVPASQLQPSDLKAPQLVATAILRVTDATNGRLPLYFERRLEAPLDVARWGQVRGDRTAFLSMSDLLPLLPGEYDWRIVFRDERSGRMGGVGGRVLLKDFRGPSTSSSLLLTRQVARRDGNAVDTDRQPLDAGAVRFVPQPSMVFAQGETVHLLYIVYNATPEDLDAVKQGMHLALLRNGRAVGDVQAAGEPVVDAKRGQIQFTGAIRTGSLEPGTYTVVGMLPNFETRSPKQVEQRFLLIAPTAGS
ncbi:MAG: VWA domain-containing protein [Vicinamibacteria bacterium]|nr:VWA domain-containing protein [Vicinamibacteria bacterium]